MQIIDGIAGLTPISIHAPVGGATGGNLIVFDPQEFQSTLPWGERLTPKIYQIILT